MRDPELSGLGHDAGCDLLGVTNDGARHDQIQIRLIVKRHNLQIRPLHQRLGSAHVVGHARVDQNLLGGGAGIIFVFGDIDIALNREGEVIATHPVCGPRFLIEPPRRGDDLVRPDCRCGQGFGTVINHLLAHLGRVADSKGADTVLHRRNRQGRIPDLNMLARVVYHPLINALFDTIPDLQPAHQTVIDLEPEFLELARLIARPEAQNQPAFGQLIRQTDIFDQTQRFVKWHHHNGRTDLDTLGLRGHVCGGHQRRGRDTVV